MKNMIEVTGIDLKEFVKDVYELSVPAGLGFIHFEEGGLSDEDAGEIAKLWEDNSRVAIDMDYVKGRACKMTVFKEDEKLFIHENWYDHTDFQLIDLLKRHNIQHAIGPSEHGAACNCAECREKRGMPEKPSFSEVLK